MRYETTVYRRDGGEHRYRHDAPEAQARVLGDWINLIHDGGFGLILRTDDVDCIEMLPLGPDEPDARPDAPANAVVPFGRVA